MDKELKRVIIKEELVELTGDFIKALVLNQFIYWTQRVKDFDRFIQEERHRMEQEGKQLDMQPANGWIYKSSEELIEELMLDISQPTMSRNIQKLVDMGYLLWRNNPIHKWDRKKQYRVDIVKVRKDLAMLGYTLEGHPFFTENNALFTGNNGAFNMNNGSVTVNDRTIENEYAIPEITTENTIEIIDIDTHTAPKVDRVDASANADSFPAPKAEGQDVVCDLGQLRLELESLGMKFNDRALRTWSQLGTLDEIVHAVWLAEKDENVRNKVAYITGVLRNGLTVMETREERMEREHREKYKGYYDLMEEGRSM